MLSLSHGATIQGSVTTAQNETPTSSEMVIQLWMLNSLTQVYEFKESRGIGPWDSYQFNFSNLTSGRYKIACQDLSGKYALQYFGGSPFFDEAEQVSLDGESQTTTANFAVTEGRMLAGNVVSNESGAPLAHIDLSVFAVLEGGLRRYVTGFPTQGDGKWKIGLPEGIYVLLFKDLFDDDGIDYAAQWFDEAVSEGSATEINATGSVNTVVGLNTVMTRGCTISGTVLDAHGSPIKGLFVTALTFDNSLSSWEPVFVTKTGVDGDYSAILPTGQYRFFFEESSMLFEHEYWDNSPSLADSATIDLSVSDTNDVVGIDVQMDYSPLALWGFQFGLNPLADVGGWLGEDTDRDGYSNLHEFAFGTDPTSAASGYPFLVRSTNAALSISALVNTNVSSAYSLQYELQEQSDLRSGAWLSSQVEPTVEVGQEPAGYTRLGISLPFLSIPKQFFRTKAMISPQ